MMLTRRALSKAALAAPAIALAMPALAAARPKPIVIAHRGASGERPEHTL
ncbi:MAG TPA: glycerophosphodiester phosphodiesterase, partial [Phenylobacterium sp.]|nr:glycerophosphodiester phosphodiesterase [Phenylobacterium sp.]